MGVKVELVKNNTRLLCTDVVLDTSTPDTKLTCKSPAGTSSDVMDVVVTTTGGEGKKTGAYTYS